MPVAAMMTMASVTLLAAILATATGFLLPAHRSVPSRRLVRGSNQLLFATEIENSEEPHIIIVGKIIMYKYGDPKSMNDDDANEVTIGGGGPQAAWGACAGLAVKDLLT